MLYSLVLHQNKFHVDVFDLGEGNLGFKKILTIDSENLILRMR